MERELGKTVWNVYFNGNFWGHSIQEEAGIKVVINQEFVWGLEKWYVPAVYKCNKGIVVDFCIQVDASRIQSFMEKWQVTEQEDEISDELREQIEAENPLDIAINPLIILNGQLLGCKRYCATAWNPCFPKGIENDLETENICEYYDCDKASGWRFIRASFPWKAQGDMRIDSLKLCLEERLIGLSGPHFTSNLQRKINFVHPVTGITHLLTIISSTEEQLSTEHFEDKEYEYPCHFKQLTYTVEPDLEESMFRIIDCNRGDSPKRFNKALDQFLPEACVGVGIIGGASGVTAIACTEYNELEKRLHTACSALYFDVTKEIEWRMLFYVKRRDDIQIDLLNIFQK